LFSPALRCCRLTSNLGDSRERREGGREEGREGGREGERKGGRGREGERKGGRGREGEVGRESWHRVEERQVYM